MFVPWWKNVCAIGTRCLCHPKLMGAALMLLKELPLGLGASCPPANVCHGKSRSMQQAALEVPSQLLTDKYTQWNIVKHEMSCLRISSQASKPVAQKVAAQGPCRACPSHLHPF
eukprot:1159878-Pelagomonas_calceolata.AAC.11